MNSMTIAEAACSIFPHGSRAEFLARTLRAQNARALCGLLWGGPDAIHL